MGLLDGKVAVITGAGSGMGKGAVEHFAREGAKVVALDVTGKEADTAAQFGDEVISMTCDVSNEDQVIKAFELATTTFGQVDALLNVAGISGTPVALHELEVKDFDQVIGVNLRGTMITNKHAVRAMLASGKGGSIVNWSSVGGTHGFPGANAYCASKAGVLGLTRVLALDYATAGIRCNAILPGFIDTPMNNAVLQVMPELGQKPPIGRPANVTEVAELAAFLASDHSVYISGTLIPFDGAWSIKIAI